MKTHPKTAEQEPWPEIKEESEIVASAHNGFEDNFLVQSDELNQNGLQLPDSKHYLSILGSINNSNYNINQY